MSARKQNNRGLSIQEIRSLRRSRPHAGRPLGEWHAAEDASLDSQLLFSWAPARWLRVFQHNSDKVDHAFPFQRLDDAYRRFKLLMGSNHLTSIANGYFLPGYGNAFLLSFFLFYVSKAFAQAQRDVTPRQELGNKLNNDSFSLL
jgi:hypothetical protein